MNTNNDIKGADVKIPAPILFFAATGGTAILNYFYPLGITSSQFLCYVGFAFIVLTLLLMLYSVFIFRKAKTTPSPSKPTTTIVTSSLFAYSRNPIYVGFCMVAFSMGLVLNSVWVLLSFIPLAISLYYLVIKKEEKYLDQKFGAEYQAYKKAVRRWL